MQAYNRSIKLATIIILSIAVLVGLFVQLNQTAQAAPAAQLDVCDTCTYTTIQTAVTAANSGDTIRVAQGTYTGMMSTSELTATVVLTKNLMMLGGFNADFSQQDPALFLTTIDTQGNPWGGVLIFGSQSTIDGFQIVNADGGGVAVLNNQDVTAVGTITNNTIAYNRIMTETQLSEGGAGIDVADGAEAFITHNEIVSNTIEREYSYGGGIRVVGSLAEINDNLIAYNLSHQDAVGGGIDLYLATAVISNNNIHHNAINGIGIYNSIADVLNNTIESNRAYGGGGLEISAESIFTVTNNVIRGNQAIGWSGGGIAINDWATGMIAYNDIVGNETDDHGGGISTYQNGELTISHNTIQQNTAQYGGGGLHVNAEGDVSFLTIEGNSFHNNTAGYGAGLHVINTNGPVQIASNDIRFNQVTGEEYQSGGILVDNTGAMVTVVNNVVAHNDNRGVKGVNYTEIELINNTIVSNGSQAIEMHAWPVTSTIPLTATIINNIIADHPECAFSGFYNAVFVVENNDVVGHDPDDCGADIVYQSDNINADPLFINPGAGNYQLQVGSPTIDSGMAGLGVPDVDIDGISRPQGGGIDMGAYEAVFNQIFLPMITKPIAVPSNNFMIEDQPFGQGYGAYSGDIHAWLSDSDGWGFAPQDPDNVTFFRWDGTEWNSFQTLPSGGWYFFGTDLEMLSATEGWAVAPRTGQGPSTFFRWNGTQWSEESSTEAGIIAMDFRSSNDGWGVGYWPSCCGAKFYHWDGISWTEKAYLVSNWPLSDIALLSNGDGWAVGTTIARQSGDSWVVYGSPVSESLNAISMVSVNDGWIVGEAGTILHWNGTAWTAVASPTTEDLWQIEMLQSNHGWAVGDNGTILRWNGTVWSVVASPVDVGFRELDMVDINEGWIPYYDNATSTYGVLHITTSGN